MTPKKTYGERINCIKDKIYISMAVDDVVIFPIKVATNGAGYASKMNIEGVMLLCKKITAENKRSRDRAEKTKFFTALTPFTPFAAVSYPYKKKGQLNN